MRITLRTVEATRVEDKNVIELELEPNQTIVRFSPEEHVIGRTKTGEKYAHVWIATRITEET